MAVNFSGSLVATGSIISTTGFTGSLSGTASNATTASSADDFLVRGTLTAQTINVQTITSSVDFVTGSSVNGSLLTNTHQFTGSVGVTGSLAINGVDYNSTSASFDTRITNTSSSLATLTTNNAIASASFDTRVNANSSSIVQLSGSYLTDSASFSTRVTTNSASISQLSSSYLAASASFETKINTISSSYATTGSNIFKGDQTITGSLLVSGSTTQIGNNTLTGNTTLSGSIAISGSQTFTGVATQIGNSYFTGSMNISGSTTQVGNNSLLGNTTLSGSIIISGSHELNNPSIKLYGDTETDGAIKFLPVTDTIDNSITGSYIYVSGSTQDLYFTQNGAGFANTTRLRWLEGNLYTGLLNGGLITAATGSTTFNVSSGSGIIVNLNASITDNPYPTVQYVNWGNLTSQSLTYLTSSIQTFVGINSSGSVVQQTNAFNDGQYNTIITLGTVLHQNKSTVNASITYPNVAYGYKQRTYDFLKAFGPLKLSGLTINTSGSLGLTVGSGTAFAEGRNYQIDPSNPSYIIDTGTSVSKIFRYYQSGSEFVQDTNNGAGYTVIDPANYNNNGTLTGVNPSTPYTIQRVFWYPNSATKGIVVYYGNQQYASSTEAIANVAYETFTEVENTKQNAVYLGAIVIRYNGVFTNPGDYNILPSGLFRNIGGSGGGGGTVTSRLIDLSDVAVSGPTNGQPLAYDTTAEKWINASTISASLAGNATTATSASYASTASFVQTSQTASFVSNAVSSSFANTASYAVTASYVLGQSPTASHALTASSADNFLVRGTLTAQTINAQTVSSSIVYSSGSNIFGDATNDNHRFTGSVLISGSLITNTPITGSSITGSFTGSLSGIASQASTLLVTTSSVSQDYSLTFAPSGADGYVQFYTDGGKDVLYNPSTNILQARNIVALNSISGSLTGSLTGTASYATQAITASFVTTAQTASYVLNAVSASFAINATGAFDQGGNSFGAAALIGTNDAQNLTLETNNANRIFISSSGYAGIGGITSPSANIPEAKLDVNGIIRARSGFQIMSDGLTTVLSSSRSDNTQAGILTFNGWGDYAFNKSLYLGYTPPASSGGNGYLFAQGGIGINKTGSLNGSLDVNGGATISGSVTSTRGFTGSLQGTATTASFVTLAQTASYVATASYALNADLLDGLHASVFATTGSNSFNGNQVITGSLAVGSIFPSSASTENTLTIGLPPAGGTGEGGQILFQASGGLYTSASMLDNWQNQFRILRGTNASSDGLVVSWNMHTKQMQLPAYNNASSFTGTAVANLAVNSNGDVITVSTTGASVFPYTGDAVITGSLTTTGIIYATPNGGMYFQGGDDAALYDINVSNHMGIYGVQDSTICSIKLGSGGGIISGKSGSIGIGTTNPTNTLQVVGGVTATSFTGSLSGNASTSTSASYAATSSYVQNAQSASYVQTAQTASYVLNAISASYAATSSYADNLIVAGTLTAQTINVQTITSSIEFNTGSTRNGSLLTNTHQFTGSVSITGSLSVNAPLTIYNNTSGNGLTFSSQNWYIGNNTANIRYNGGVGYDFIGQSDTPVRFQLGGVVRMQLTGSSGALMLQNGGTYTDNGYRLQIQPAVSGALWVSGSTVLSGSVISTNGFTGSLQGTATTASYVLNAVSSSFASTSSYSNDFTIGGTLTFDGTLTDYNTVASSIVGTNNIFTKATGSYTSAFIKYTVTSGSNARSGEVMTVWNGTSTQYVDNSTLDIGDTSPVVISTSIVTSQIQINAATSNSGWRIKAIGTFI